MGKSSAYPSKGANGAFKNKPTLAQRRKDLRFAVNTKTTGASGVSYIRDRTNQITTPKIFFTREAWAKQCHLVRLCSKEVGWFALVEHDAEKNIFVITELVIPAQTVSATETDIGKEDLADAALELIEQGKDTSKLYAWFHSHVNMGVTPSEQDEFQVEDYLEDLVDVPEIPAFIRGIQNKKGDLKLDVYYVQQGIAYQNLDYQILNEEDEEWQKEIETEIKLKVTEQKYTGYSGNYQFGGSGGSRNGNTKSGPQKNTGNGVGRGTNGVNGFRRGNQFNQYGLPYYDDETSIVELNTPVSPSRSPGGAPTPIATPQLWYHTMETVYETIEGEEVLLDEDNKLWVCDLNNDIYDYEDYVAYYGELGQGQ